MQFLKKYSLQKHETLVLPNHPCGKLMIMCVTSGNTDCVIYLQGIIIVEDLQPPALKHTKAL